jgi:tRNA dimethylallyltransferase
VPKGFIPNNIKRVIRALEVFETTGRPISEHQAQSRRIKPEFDYRIYGLEMERNLLYERIDRRADIMVAQGLEQEVRGLLEMGYSKDLVSMQAIGYKEIIAAINNECSLTEAIDRIKLLTRHLAKRQMTWFKSLED